MNRAEHYTQACELLERARTAGPTTTTDALIAALVHAVLAQITDQTSYTAKRP